MLANSRRDGAQGCSLTSLRVEPRFGLGTPSMTAKRFPWHKNLLVPEERARAEA